jgi:DNA-binding HxlR family transcriptional regulator
VRGRATWADRPPYTQTLKDLEADGFVLRTAHQVVPPHVDYELTLLGRAAAVHVVALVGWIEAALPEILAGQVGVAAE